MTIYIWVLVILMCFECLGRISWLQQGRISWLQQGIIPSRTSTNIAFDLIISLVFIFWGLFLVLK